MTVNVPFAGNTDISGFLSLPSKTKQSNDVAENEFQDISNSILLKSEKAGISILSGIVISIMDGKSFTAVNLVVVETVSPLPKLL